MRYFKLIYYTTGGEYETNEMLMNEPYFRQIQKAMAQGKDLIVLEDRIIKRSSIKELSPADDIVQEHISTGLSLESIGVKEGTMLESGEKEETKKLWH